MLRIDALPFAEKFITYVQILFTLHMKDITSNIPVVTKFVTAGLYTILHIHTEPVTAVIMIYVQ
jgi:hypothetical protein